MKKLILAALLAAPMGVSAAEGEVCIAKAIQPASEHSQALTNETRFECLAAGNDTTIPEIYKNELLPVSQTPSLGVMMKPEVANGKENLYPRVQA